MNRPDFTAIWKFNREESALEIPSPDSTIFVIEHHEPHFHLERTHTAGKSSDTFSIDLVTDGNIVTKHHNGIEIRSRMFWENEVLVFISDLRRGSEQGTNIVRYQLANDRLTFTADEQQSFSGRSYHNRWVFDKQLRKVTDHV